MSVYKHSDSLGSALFIGPVLALIATVVLAIVYSYIDVYSPIAGYISLLFVGGFAFGLMMSVNRIVLLAKCRSQAFATLFGFGTGGLALYLSWVVFVYALMSRYDETFEAGMLDILLSPSDLWATILHINETGWYSIRSATPSGMVLWAFWGVEAILVVGGATLGGMTALNGAVFCERCNAWCDDDEVSPRLRLPEGELDPAVVAVEVSALEALPAAAQNENPHLMLSMKKCVKCERMATARLQLITYEADDDGDVTEETEVLSQVHEFSLEPYQRLVALADREVQSPGPQTPADGGTVDVSPS